MSKKLEKFKNNLFMFLYFLAYAVAGFFSYKLFLEKASQNCFWCSFIGALIGIFIGLGTYFFNKDFSSKKSKLSFSDKLKKGANVLAGVLGIVLAIYIILYGEMEGFAKYLLVFVLFLSGIRYILDGMGLSDKVDNIVIWKKKS